MDKLIAKEVEFNGDILKAAQDPDGNIWVGARWVCEAIGLDDNRIKYERRKMQTDSVISKGVQNFTLLTIGDLYEKYKSICNQDATDSIIAPLVEKYGDKSNGGMVTYRKVYKKMGEMSPINWHNLEVRYINKHGKAGARRKKIISSNPEMLRKFKNAVDVMMVG